MEIRKLTTLEEKVQAQKISTLAFVFPADMEKEAERLRQLPESSEEYQVERWGRFSARRSDDGRSYELPLYRYL